MPLSLDPDTVEDMFSMEDFLAAEQAKELVRFSTAGSVDDGKSTLIGRLLYDSQNVYEDHVRAVTKAASANVKRGAGRVRCLGQTRLGLRATSSRWAIVFSDSAPREDAAARPAATF